MSFIDKDSFKIIGGLFYIKHAVKFDCFERIIKIVKFVGFHCNQNVRFDLIDPKLTEFNVLSPSRPPTMISLSSITATPN